MQNLAPGNVNHEGNADVCKKREGEPLQVFGIGSIWNKNNGREREDAEDYRKQGCASGEEQGHRRTHGADVGTQIEDVGCRHQQENENENWFWITLAEIGGESATCDAPDATADFLDCRHQGVGQEHGPKKRIAELRTHLRIGRDTARIVIRGSGDEARA